MHLTRCFVVHRPQRALVEVKVLRLRWLVLVVAVVFGLDAVGAPIAHASIAPQQPAPMTAVPLAAGTVVDLSAAPSVDGHHLTVELVQPETGRRISASKIPGLAQPAVTVGAGWYLYVIPEPR